MRFHLLYIAVFALLIIGTCLEHEQEPPKKQRWYPYDTTAAPPWKDPDNVKQIKERYGID